MAHFHANRKQIAKKYTDQLVAILDSQVIDSDDDLGNLASRVRNSFAGRDPYMPWANAMSLEEVFERFQIEGPVDLSETGRRGRLRPATKSLGA